MRSKFQSLSGIHFVKLGIVVGLFLLSYQLTLSVIYAQGNGFQLSPPTIELEADPGETITVEDENALTIRNITSETLVAEAEFNDFLPQDETGTPSIITEGAEVDTGDYSMVDWFGPLESFQLEPEERISLPITITVPENATPGGHYGVVRFTASAPQGESAVSLSASVGTLFLVNVSGDIQEDINLIEAGVTRNGEAGTFFQQSPDTLFTRFQNVGNTHTKPFGAIQIKNIFGTVVHELEINPGRGNVLPDSVRRFESELPDQFNFGRYSVEGALAYGNGNGDIMPVDFSFWVIPIQVIIAVVVGLPVLFFGGRFALRRYNERVVAKSRRR